MYTVKIGDALPSAVYYALITKDERGRSYSAPPFGYLTMRTLFLLYAFL